MFQSIKLNNSSRLNKAKLKQNIILVVDDINYLGIRFSDDDNQQSMYFNDLLLKLLHLGTKIKVLLISSSSRYFNQLKNKSFVRKQSQFHIIQPKSQEQLMKATMSMIQLSSYNGNNQMQIAQYLIRNQYSLRYIKGFINTIVSYSQTYQQVMNNLKIYYDIIYQKESSDIRQILFKRGKMKQGTRQLSQFLNNIIKLSSKSKIEENDCSKVIYQPKNQKTNQLNFQQIKIRRQTINNLDQRHKLVFCHPRSDFYKRIFQEIVRENYRKINKENYRKISKEKNKKQQK